MQTEQLDLDIVATGYGKLRGQDLGEVTLFSGIPYAQPPVGALRWKPPVKPEAWSGVRDATVPPQQAPQNQDYGVFARPGGQEDCLYLNVWAPKQKGAPPAGLPVMVWIHGGGLCVGTSIDHDGSRLVTEGGIIVVTINYRLGILGNFAHPAIIAEGGPWGNYWLMDQQAALRWVRENIASFGGNPDNVTIFGESTGGASVMGHVVSPASKGLFHHAVSMSGCAVLLRHPHFGAPKPAEVAIEASLGFAAAAGCAGEGADAAACLRGLSVERILELQAGHLLNQAIIDGTLVPAHHTDMIKAGRVNGQTFTGGVTRNEFNWTVGFTENATGKPLSETDYVEALNNYYGPEIGAKVLAQYPVSNYTTPSEALGAAVTSSLFTCTNHKALELLSAWMPVFGYEFADTTAPSYLEHTSFSLGAGHTFELAYLFPGYHGGAGRQTSLNAMQEKLAAKMVELFSKTHLADGEREADWPRYNPADENYLSLILPEPKMMHQKFSDIHKSKFWDSVGLY